MELNTVNFLPLNAATTAETRNGPALEADFGLWLEKGLSEVNNDIISSDNQLRQLAMGEAENLHQVMLEMEKAKLNFSLVLQVRNKLLEAYQDIMRMQL